MRYLDNPERKQVVSFKDDAPPEWYSSSQAGGFSEFGHDQSTKVVLKYKKLYSSSRYAIVAEKQELIDSDGKWETWRFSAPTILGTLDSEEMPPWRSWRLESPVDVSALPLVSVTDEESEEISRFI